MGAIEQSAADGVGNLVAGAIDNHCPEGPDGAPATPPWRYTCNSLG